MIPEGALPPLSEVPEVQDVVNALVLGSIYVLIAIGLTLVYGILRILHIAHAGIYTLGAFLGLTFYHLTGSFWLSLALSLILTGIAGVGVYTFFYRKVLAEERIVPLVISIGLFIVMQDLYRLIWGPYRQPFAVRFGIGDIKSGGVVITEHQLVILLITATTLVILYFLMNHTKMGKAMKACADDAMVAGALGVNVERTISLAFFLGSALAALAGILVGVYENNVYPTMGEVPSYKSFVVIVLGGFGSLMGAVVAGFILAFAETALVAWKGFVLPRDAIAFLVMIAVLMIKPEGLFRRGTK